MFRLGGVQVRSIEVEVRSETVHARPAAAFVRAASGFASAIRLENVTAARPAVDAKSIVGLLSAAVDKGHIVRIVAEGIDEDRAVDELARLLAGLGEPVGD
jgi:phosphotransferase system HPr (HPr) family protein